MLLFAISTILRILLPTRYLAGYQTPKKAGYSVQPYRLPTRHSTAIQLRILAQLKKGGLDYDRQNWRILCFHPINFLQFLHQLDAMEDVPQSSFKIPSCLIFYVESSKLHWCSLFHIGRYI